jgi:chemotaxis protein methyltransferase WspC
VRRIESLLSREIGLSARSIGESAVEAAVKTRLRACGTSELSEYFARLERDPSERRALVEEIVVSETWFFRDDDVFKALKRHAAAWLTRDKPLRVLSLPCATGEEAYSVAISLLESGLRETRFTVRGVDVSERALDHARRAEYGKISFRGVEPRLQRYYFEQDGSSWRLLDVAKSAVTFAQGNVLDTSLCAPRSCDVILCRNLLIYLDPQARSRALDNLHGWLTDDGLLFGGHAEALELMDPRFQRMVETAAFAYVKPGQKRSEARGGTGRIPVLARPAASAAQAARRRPDSQPQKVAVASDTGARPVVDSLARATDLANRGRLDEARAMCERLLAQAGASAEAYCLLGIIAGAAGALDEAITHFNKSLYLKQDHHEALVHLALLHEQRGQHAAAANFRRRAERTRGGEPE